MLKSMKFSKKLMFNALFVITGFALVLSTQYYLGTQKQKHMAQDVFSTYSQSLGEMIDAQFVERYGDVQAFSKNMVFQGFSPQMVTNTLNSYVKLYGTYDFILFVNLEGKPVASSDETPDGKKLDLKEIATMDFKNEPWFQGVVKNNYLKIPEKNLDGTYFENPHHDPVKSLLKMENTFGASFSAPVFSFDGRQVGVLTARTSMAWIETPMMTIYKSLQSQGIKESEVTLIDKNGVLLSEYDHLSPEKGMAFNHDPAIIGKFNLIENKVSAAIEAQRGHLGSMISPHKRKAVEQVAGYGPVWKDSLGQTLGWSTLVRSNAKLVFQDINFAQMAFLISVAVCYIVAIFIFIYFSRSVSSSLNLLSDQISKTGEGLIQSGTELSTASDTVSNEATKSASALEQIAASMEELTSMVKHNAEQAKTAAQVANESNESAQEGESRLRSLTESMQDIQRSAHEIAEIISVVDDIAFQTNLLALNAAVEAARAGEQGRGFAVVADAVRTLAQRSAEASKNISSLIRESIQKTKTGGVVADQTGEAFRVIIHSIQKLSQMVGEISTSTNEQSNGLIQISSGINQIDSSTQRNAATSEELSSSAKQLQHQAESLGEAASKLYRFVHGDGNNSQEPSALPRTFETEAPSSSELTSDIESKQVA